MAQSHLSPCPESIPGLGVDQGGWGHAAEHKIPDRTNTCPEAKQNWLECFSYLPFLLHYENGELGSNYWVNPVCQVI